MPALPRTVEDEDALIPISALQHYLFCPRQCALIHTEQVWVEDKATAEGRLLHEKVDGGQPETRKKVRTARGIALRSFALGVTGKADVVEFHTLGKGQAPHPFPVEYKRGKPKSHRADEVQLCAQALCLEEMFGVTISEGALFYGLTRKRLIVRLDEDLRSLTIEIATAARLMLASTSTPPPVRKPGCRSCSLHDMCRPDTLENPVGVARWLAAQLRDESL